MAALLLLMSCSTTPDNFYDTGTIGFSNRHDERLDPSLVEVGNRVQAVAYRLKLASTQWCGPHIHHETGLSVWDADVARLLGLASVSGPSNLGASPTVLYVAPGSAAARAGVQPGDVIELVDGGPVEKGMEGARQLSLWNQGLGSSGRTTTMSVRRQSQAVTVTLVPDRVCDFHVTLKLSDWGIGHYAPARDVSILLRETGVDDDALAFTIAHGAAHGLMNHADQRKRSGASASLADTPFFLIGVPLAIASMGAYPESLATPFENSVPARMQLELEPKADLWGLYMMAAAGYDFDSVIQMSLGSIRPPGEPENASATKVRVQHLSDASKSIQDLQRRGIPLSPDTGELKTLMNEVVSSKRK